MASSERFDDDTQPLRITFDTSLLDSLSSDMKEYILKLLNTAAQFMKILVKVDKTTGNNIFKGENGICGPVTVIEIASTEGIENSDLHLFITSNNIEMNQFAKADRCSVT